MTDKPTLRHKRLARRWRLLLLIFGILYALSALAWLALPLLNEKIFEDFGGVGLLGTPMTIAPLSDSSMHYAVNVMLVLGLLMLAQWAFLRPGRYLAARLTVSGRPLRGAILSASFMAMLLTVGFVVIILELTNQWGPLVDVSGNYMVTAPSVYVGMGIGWAAWTIVFYAYWRQGDRYTQLGKMIRGLVAGSLLETLVAVPVHIWVVRQRECYCERGSYTALVFSGTVLLWAFGPGIILLYMHERYRLAKIFPKCPNCGYDLRASRERCPECGLEIASILSEK